MRRKKITDQYAEEKRWVFSLDLKEASEDECLTEKGREFQITGRGRDHAEQEKLPSITYLTAPPEP